MPDKLYARPSDQSLQAFKDWMQGMVLRLNPNAKDTMTEEEWIESWKEFWDKEDDATATQGSKEKQ